MIKKILSLLSLGFIMTGCTVQPAKIPYTAVETNQKVNVYSVIEQDELDALYPIQRAGDHFGLIGSLSDAAENARRAKVTERNLLDIRNELIEFNFDQIFNEEVTNKLKNNVHINNVSSYKSTKQLDNKIMAGETYLVLNTSYKLDMDYRTPFIVTKVIIAQKNKEQPGSLDNDKKLYKNTFTYFGHTLPILDTRQLSQEEINAIALKNDTYDPEFDFDYELSDEDIYNMTAQSWTIEYKGQLEQQLRKAAQNLLTIIANDIKDTTLPENYIDKGTVPAGYPYYSESTLVEKNEEYTVMRFTYGTRAGAICVMPTKGNEGKILCL